MILRRRDLFEAETQRQRQTSFRWRSSIKVVCARLWRRWQTDGRWRCVFLSAGRVHWMGNEWRR